MLIGNRPVLQNQGKPVGCPPALAPFPADRQLEEAEEAEEARKLFVLPDPGRRTEHLPGELVQYCQRRRSVFAAEAEEAEVEVEVEAALEALEPVQAPPAAGNTNLHQSLAMPRTPPRLFGTLRIALW